MKTPSKEQEITDAAEKHFSSETPARSVFFDWVSCRFQPETDAARKWCGRMEWATRQNSQLAAAPRVAMKMGRI